MRARPERPAGVDDDRERSRRRTLPGWADPERADANRAVELAPAILPSGLDLAPRRVRERGEDAPGRLAVRGQLELAGTLDLLEPLRGELDEPRAELLGRLDRNADRGADQRNALFSFSKKPSSGR